MQYDIRSVKIQASGESESTRLIEISESLVEAGFRSLDDIAVSLPQEIIAKTENIIRKENLSLKVPLIKEIKKHIAVARAFTDVMVE